MPILQRFERDNLFQTDFMLSLANEYWMGYLKKIIVKALLPWVTYSVLSLVYFAHTLDQEFEKAEQEEIVKWKALGVSLLILVSYLLYIEFKQIQRQK